MTGDPPLASFHERSGVERQRLGRRGGQLEEARSELGASGLEVLGVFGVEGPGWTAPDFDGR